ncbi:LRR receptor-like serine/threonine-protein kinase GSO1-like [Hibiscus syriacus]|uniref:LRR receptor-like serine/threonine-protein kinase GSO1-like n=1 Tax=Hibiscus syriacus TaxID=106335 RepID=A0A6A2YNS6_HIBSY|nr:uncharacterized protein LOC120159097 [Hibiscus syriacus]KAE8681021.1 LRR receptor-like serine/threonine-protein kinase GSO1-like [Hibiscus syriacus]
MGNCLRHQSSTQWGGEDWAALIPAAANDDDDDSGGDNIEEKGLLQFRNRGRIGSTTSSSATHEVKVKITRKQLVELLGRVDLKELSVQQVLAQLINVSHQYDQADQRSWRPALQSIPEVN